MQLKKTLKRIVVYGSLLACLNYYVLPLVSSIAAKSIKSEIQNKKIQQVCQTDQHLEDVLSSIDRFNVEPLQLLKAAHAITSKKLDLTSAFLPGRGEREKAYKGGADCTYFSIFTYSNFLYLADAIGRPSLKDKVRLMIGVGYYEGKTYEGHVWLQVNIDGKWHDYETSKDLIKKNEKSILRN